MNLVSVLLKVFNTLLLKNYSAISLLYHKDFSLLEVSKKGTQVETKKYQEPQPKKEPTPWRYVGNGRECQPPRILEKAGAIVEKLREENGKLQRFVIEEAILLLAEQFQQVLVTMT